MNYGGRRYSHDAIVHSNDPKNPAVHIYITGDVKAFATVWPQMVRFEGAAGQPLSQAVSITPNYPFRVKGVSASPGKNIKLTFEEGGTEQKRVYAVKVTNTCPGPRRYVEKIVVETDSGVRPRFEIPVYGNILAGPVQGRAVK